jgi:hypothetical protein
MFMSLRRRSKAEPVRPSLKLPTCDSISIHTQLPLRRKLRAQTQLDTLPRQASEPKGIGVAGGPGNKCQPPPQLQPWVQPMRLLSLPQQGHLGQAASPDPRLSKLALSTDVLPLF